MEIGKNIRDSSAALLDGMDSSVSCVLKSAESGEFPASEKQVVLYIRKIPCPEQAGGPRFKEVIKRYADENGDVECEVRFRNKNNDSDVVWVKTKLNMLKESRFSSLFAAEFENITALKELEATRRNRVMLEALEAAQKDSATGVYNKYFTEDLISDKLACGDGSISMLIILDIDLLKSINDTYGHPVGDIVLKTIGGIMISEFRQDDIIGRIGGDEFMALISRVADETAARKIVERLLRRISETSICGLNISVSIGCVLTESGREDFSVLYQKADKALYHVKRNGRNGYDFYTSENE